MTSGQALMIVMRGIKFEDTILGPENHANLFQSLIYQIPYEGASLMGFLSFYNSIQSVAEQ